MQDETKEKLRELKFRAMELGPGAIPVLSTVVVTVLGVTGVAGMEGFANEDCGGGGCTGCGNCCTCCDVPWDPACP
jgi:hypothetical protein